MSDIPRLSGLIFVGVLGCHVGPVLLAATDPDNKQDEGGSTPTKCHEGMVWVPAGMRPRLNGLVSRDSGAAACAGTDAVELAAFCLDINEVSVAEYARCVAVGRCPALACAATTDRVDVSVTCTTWAGAEAYCAWRGVRVPTRDEWLREATNGDDRLFPWGGDSAVLDLCTGRDDAQGPCVTRRLTGDVSAHGVRDMAANASEWASPGACMGDSWSHTNGSPRIQRYALACGVSSSPPSECGIRCAANP